MKTAPILRQTWQIIRENPALLALGLFVVFGAGTGALGEKLLGLLSPISIPPNPLATALDLPAAPSDPSALPLPGVDPRSWLDICPTLPAPSPECGQPSMGACNVSGAYRAGNGVLYHGDTEATEGTSFPTGPSPWPQV